MIDKMLEAMRLTFMQVKNKLDRRYGCFEIFGVDFLLSDDLSPKLMEITSCPSYSLEMDDSKPILRSLVRDAVTMVQELHEKNREKAREEMMERVLKCA